MNGLLTWLSPFIVYKYNIKFFRGQIVFHRKALLLFSSRGDFYRFYLKIGLFFLLNFTQYSLLIFAIVFQKIHKEEAGCGLKKKEGEK